MRYMDFKIHNSKIDDLDPFLLDLLGLGLYIYNPNPMQDLKDKRDRDDCSIRSICKFLNKPWDEVYHEMTEYCIEAGEIIGNADAMVNYLKNYDIMIEELDGTDITVAEYLYRHKSDKFILTTHTHAVCIINGKIYDNYASRWNINDFLIQKVLIVIRKSKSRRKNKIKGN